MEFPSPYGVSFILMKDLIEYQQFVDDGFRLLTEYRSFLLIVS